MTVGQTTLFIRPSFTPDVSYRLELSIAIYRDQKSGEVVDVRNLVYYSNINAEKTQEMASRLVSLKEFLPEGWNGAIAPDENCAYFIASNFRGENVAVLKGIQYDGWAPVFYQPTTIADNASEVTFTAHQNSIANQRDAER